MTVKAFFRSNAFKSLAVLIAIVLAAGALLAICNDVFYISDEERLNRTLSKIYGESVSAQPVELAEEHAQSNYGTVNSIYYITDDGNYLLNTTGVGGFRDGAGTVTLWTVIACEESTDGLRLTGIRKVVYESNEGQTYIGSLTDAFYNGFTQKNELVAAGGYFIADKNSSDALNNVAVGASQSSTAACNAVNAALSYFRSALSGGVQ